MLCVPTPPTFVYYMSSFSDNAQQFGYPLLETAIHEFSATSFVSFIRIAEYSVANFFLPVRLLLLADVGSIE